MGRYQGQVRHMDRGEGGEVKDPQANCACVALDATTCAAMRDRRYTDDEDINGEIPARKCECACHSELFSNEEEE